MKKLLALALFGAMTASLVACGSSSAPADDTAAPADTAATTDAGAADAGAADAGAADAAGEKTEELSFAWWGNQTRTENTEAALDAYTALHPGITFDTQAYQWSDYWTALATSSAGGQLPDIIQQDYAYINQYVENDLLVDLTPYIESGALDCSKVADSVMDTGKVGDKVYALCAGVNAPALYYNKTLTDSLGIEVPDNMTMDQFSELSKKIFDESGVKTAWGYGPQENFSTYWMRSKGYSSFYDEKAFTFKSADEYTPFFQYMKDSLDAGWLLGAEVYADIDYTSVEQSPLVYFSSPATQSWCYAQFSNQMSAIVAAAPEGVEIGITTWPSDDPKASNYIKPSQFFAISKDCKDIDTAIDILNYFTNDVDVNINCLKAERGIPISSEVSTAVAPTLDEVQQTVTKYINDVATPNSTTIFAPLPAKSAEANEVIGDNIDQLLYGKITPEEAAKNVFEQGNAILATE